MTLCTLLVVLNLGAVALYKGSRALFAWLGLDSDPRAELINYKSAPWAAQHFAELKKLEQEYHSYLGWRRQAFEGQTVNIDAQGRRASTSDMSAPIDAYFFGGSVVWGTGGRDADTIPSVVAHRAPSLHTSNWAETGYTAHQSLERLMQVYAAGDRPPVVIFMDGVNDIAFKCRAGHSTLAHGLEADFRQRIDYLAELRPDQLITPVFLFMDKLWRRLKRGSNTTYDCHADPSKAQAVAQALVDDWRMAQQLVTSWRGHFLAFLQPVAYLSDSPVAHLDLNGDLGAQYAAVYPVLKRLLSEQANMIDLSSALDGKDYTYIDFCHLSPLGNEKIAAAMVNALSARGLTTLD
jgi:lysophospholipase L1-like esterase